MTEERSDDPLAVSRLLAKTALIVFAILAMVAALLVAVAQVSTCFGRTKTRASDGIADVLVRVDTSIPSHRDPMRALQSVWASAGYSSTVEVLAVRSQEINAASLGNGRFVFWEGLASLTRPELDAVFAHEVAHDLLHHARKAADVQDVVDVFGEVLGTLGHADNATDSVVHRWARDVTLPKYSRAQEYQADSLGAILLSRMGYDGRHTMASMLELLLARYGNAEGGFFDYHPSVRERIAALSR